MSLDSTPQIALVVARGLHFAATSIVWGGGGLLCLLPFRGQCLALKVVRLAAVLAGLSGTAWLLATFVIVTGGASNVFDPDTWLAFWHSAFGRPWAIHLALAVCCLALGILKPSRPALLGLAISGGAMAINQAWLGHAATGAGQAGVAGLASQAIHVAAGYAWTGALPVLCVLIREEESRHAVQALALFSTIGLLVVATIVATGALNLSFRLDSTAQLYATPYGRIVMTKMALASGMIALAWANRTFAASRQTKHLRRGVIVETILGAFALGAAAILGVSAPSG